MNKIDRRAQEIAILKEAGDTLQISMLFPFDLSNLVFEFIIENASSQIAVKTIGDGLSVAGEDNDTLVVNFDDNLAPGKYYYRIRVTDEDGNVRTYTNGLYQVDIK
jgi:hypothetical protein